MTIVKYKKEIFLLFLLSAFFSKTFSQSTKEEKLGNYSAIVNVSDTPPDLKANKILDSLLKLETDTAIIRYSEGGDIKITHSFARVFKNVDKWSYNNDNISLGHVPNEIRKFDDLVSRKDIFISYSDSSSSSQEHYFYLIIVKNKIIESILADKPLEQINFDNRLIKDLRYFEGFDKYVSRATVN